MNTQQKLARLAEILGKLQEAQTDLSTRTQNPVDDYFKSKIDEWASKILGIASGYEGEFDQMFKHRITKYRTLTAGHADVTVGDQGTMAAKSIQVKSTTQAAASAVNSMIAEALNQLSGERGEMPRQGDRLVVDMIINNGENTWPADKSYFGKLDWNAYKEKACAKILELCNGYENHQIRNQGKGLSPQTIGSFSDAVSLRIDRLRDVSYPKTNSTQLVSVSSGGMFGQTTNKLAHLTVKIRHMYGYPIVNGYNMVSEQNTYLFMYLAVFNVIRRGNSLSCHLDKSRFFNRDGLQLGTD